jgi:hypothetical protein
MASVVVVVAAGAVVEVLAVPVGAIAPLEQPQPFGTGSVPVTPPPGAAEFCARAGRDAVRKDAPRARARAKRRAEDVIKGFLLEGAGCARNGD